MTVRRVDHQRVGARVEQRLRLARDVTRDAYRSRRPQPALLVEGRLVQARPHSALAGDDSHDPAGRVDNRRQPVTAVVQLVERALRGDAVGQRQQLRRHHRTDLGEHVDVGAVGFGHDTHGPAVLHDDDRTVPPLGKQVERLTDGS
jgi:hypothetical protein